jgi:hypothetical protein
MNEKSDWFSVYRATRKTFHIPFSSNFISSSTAKSGLEKWLILHEKSGMVRRFFLV